MADNFNEAALNALNDINNTVQNSTDQTINSIQSSTDSLTEAITNAAANIGDGLKLTAKNTGKDSESKAESTPSIEGLKAELDGLRVVCPEMWDLAEFLIDLNSEVIEVIRENKPEGKTKTEEEENKDKAFTVDVAAKETSKLAGLTNLGEITGTGFSIVGNMLKDLYDLFSVVLDGVVAGQLSAALVASTAGRTLEAKAADTGEDKPKGKALAGFFESLQGPLTSVAGSMLLLSVAISILNTIQLDSQLIGTIILLQSFMLITFTVLARISKKYLENKDLLDPTGSSAGSLTALIKDFSLMLLAMSATMFMCATIVNIVREQWLQTLTGLVLLVGVTFITLTLLSGVATLISNELKPSAALSQMVQDFSKLLLTISAVAILCAIMWPTILTGLTYASMILGITLVTMLGIVGILAAIKGLKAAQIQAFVDLTKTVTVLIGTIAIMAIVLGIIPESIIIQGLVAVTLITALTLTIFVGVNSMLKQLGKVSASKIKALMGVLITSIALIAMLSVLTIVLGSIDTGIIVQGLATITVLLTLPFVMLNLLAKLASQKKLLGKALEGLLVTAAVTIAVSAVAWVIISMFADFSVSQILAAGLAITMTLATFAITALAIVAFSAVSPALTAAIVPALLGIAIISVAVVAVAGLTRLMIEIIGPENAEAAIQCATAVMLTTTAMVQLAGAIMLLAGVSLVISIALIGARKTIKALKAFMPELTENLIQLAQEASLMQAVDIAAISTTVDAIKDVASGLASLIVPLLAFNAVGAVIAINLITLNAFLTVINVSMVGTIGLLYALNFTVSKLPASLDLSKATKAIEELSNFSVAVNNFVTPNAQNMVGLAFTLNYVNSFIKKLSNIADSSAIDKITGLSNSLSSLAQTASGMLELAGAIQAVASATSELNEVNNSSKTSIEALTGSVKNDVRQIVSLQKPKEAAVDMPGTEILEKLTSVVETLQEMLSSMTKLTANTTRMADVQMSAAAAPRSAYMSKT